MTNRCAIAIVLALGAASCCRRAAPQAIAAERIVVVGGATYRTARAGGVIVLVRRELGDVAGLGDAQLAGPTIEAAQRTPHARLAGARAWLSVSQLAPPDAAYLAAQRGIQELGDDYAQRGTHDDTGNYVKMAELDLGRDPARAARTLRRALEDRIRLYTKRYSAEAR